MSSLEQFQCDVAGCSASFTSQRGLTQHMRHAHVAELIRRREVEKAKPPGKAGKPGCWTESETAIMTNFLAAEGGKTRGYSSALAALIPTKTKAQIREKARNMGASAAPRKPGSKQIQSFESLPQKSALTRFFHQKDFYTVQGLPSTLSPSLKNSESDDMQPDYEVLNKSQFETFVRDLLLVKRYRVEVFSNKKTSNDPEWVLEYKGSPGNLSQFEDMLFANCDQVESPAILAVKSTINAKNKIVGVASVDVVANTISLCEFSDDEHWSNLEAVVVQVGPKEVLIPTDQVDDKFKMMMERSGALLTDCNGSEFAIDNLVQDMNKLILFEEGQRQNCSALPQMNLCTATCALAALVKYLELCSNEEHLNEFELTTLEQTRYVYLDTASVNALSLLPTAGEGEMHPSLLGLLDKCCTPQGHRLVSQWVKQPLKDLALINKRLDVVQCLIEDKQLRQALLEDHLPRIPDLQTLANRLQRKKATMLDCYRIYQAMQRLPMLLDALKKQNGGQAHPTLRTVLIEPLQELIGNMNNFQQMMEEALDMDQVDNDHQAPKFLIKPQFDDELQEMTEEMNGLEEKIKRQLNKAARDLSLEPHKTVKLESDSQYGYFLRVSKKREKALKGQSSYTILDSTKIGVRFRNEKMTRLNEQHSKLKKQYTEQQERMIAQMIFVAASYTNDLQALSDLLAWLDVVRSFASVAAGAPGPYVRPKMVEAGDDQTGRVMRLKQCRHPYLETLPNSTHVPNDIELDAEVTMMIVTSPTKGGKSTFIRSAGVAALMAHIGCFVPCAEAEMSVLDAILARAGDETDSQHTMATPNSLVILDEMGTSAFEACGIVHHLAKQVKSLTLLATSFVELTRLSATVQS